MQLRHPTTMERATVSTEAAAIIEAEHGAPPGAVRRVRIMTPPAPRIAITIDSPTPTEMGPGRTYKMGQLPANYMVAIWLQAHQVIYAATVSGTGGMAEVSVLCEYFDEEPPL